MVKKEGNVARTIEEIEIEGRRLNTLFDTGSMNTDITKEFAPIHRLYFERSFRVGLSGETKEIKETCTIKGKIEGLEFSTDADVIGIMEGKQIDIIIGARAMERWEIKLDPKTGELDLTGPRRREFTEY